MSKTKIEVDDQEAREFELFRLCKMLTNGERFEYLQHQRTKEGRVIIHLKVKKNEL